MQRAVSSQEYREALQVVAGTKFFFGHQSVGRNILAGLSDLSPGGPIRLVETSDASAFAAPVFAHAPVGENSGR